LAWDFGYGFDLPRVYESGRWVLAAAAALTVVTWLAATTMQ
jgi:succinate dehydrogenase/fumarate reductase cytochrome b subunit